MNFFVLLSSLGTGWGGDNQDRADDLQTFNIRESWNSQPARGARPAAAAHFLKSPLYGDNIFFFSLLVTSPGKGTRVLGLWLLIFFVGGGQTFWVESFAYAIVDVLGLWLFFSDFFLCVCLGQTWGWILCLRQLDRRLVCHPLCWVPKP